MTNKLYFLHEHPWTARSWTEPEMKKLLSTPGVFKVKGDMCEFEMTQEDGQGVGRIRKSTGFATNAPQLARRLAKTCTGQHRHIHLIGGRAKAAEIYPPKLCKAIIEGLVSQMEEDGKIEKGSIGVIMAVDPLDNYRQFWDDVSGDPLDPEGVLQARKEELVHVHKHEVYRKVPISQCLERTGNLQLARDGWTLTRETMSTLSSNPVLLDKKLRLTKGMIYSLLHHLWRR